MEVKTQNNYRKEILRWFKRMNIRIRLDELEIVSAESKDSFDVYIRKKRSICRSYLGRFVFSEYEIEAHPSLREVIKVLDYIKDEAETIASYSPIMDILAQFVQQVGIEDLEHGIFYDAILSIVQRSPWFSFDHFASINFTKSSNAEHTKMLNKFKKTKYACSSKVHTSEEECIRLIAKAGALFKGKTNITDKEVRRAFLFYEAMLKVLYERYVPELSTKFVEPENIAVTSGEVEMFTYWEPTRSIPESQRSTRRIISRIVSYALFFGGFKRLSMSIEKANRTVDPQLQDLLNRLFGTG